MTLLESIDRITEWVQSEICDKIELKIPDDYRNDASYPVEYIHPAAFPLYVPGKERLAPNVRAPYPSVCVQLMEGSDDLLKKSRLLQIRLCLCCWNPGTHGDEIFHPRTNAAALAGRSYFRESAGVDQAYRRNSDGWRDVFNLADLVLQEVEGTEYIAGHRLAKESPIKYGLFTEDGAIWDYYPYWHSWVSFSLEAGIVARVPKAYEDFL